ncbi:MAG: hypothetical protein ACK5L5_11055 [Bacteroidales bacterium]
MRNYMVIALLLVSCMTAIAQTGRVEVNEDSVKTKSEKLAGFSVLVKETTCGEIDKFLIKEINSNDISSLFKKKENKASVEEYDNKAKISNATITSISPSPLDVNMELVQDSSNVFVKLSFAHEYTIVTKETSPNEYEAAKEFTRLLGVKANKLVVGKLLDREKYVLKETLRQKEKTNTALNNINQSISNSKAKAQGLEYDKNKELQFVEKQTRTVTDMKNELVTLPSKSPEHEVLKERVSEEGKRLKKARSNLDRLQKGVLSENQKIADLEQEKVNIQKQINQLADPEKQKEVIARITEKLDNIK